MLSVGNMHEYKCTVINNLKFEAATWNLDSYYTTYAERSFYLAVPLQCLPPLAMYLSLYHVDDLSVPLSNYRTKS